MFLISFPIYAYFVIEVLLILSSFGCPGLYHHQHLKLMANLPLWQPFQGILLFNHFLNVLSQ